MHSRRAVVQALAIVCAGFMPHATRAVLATRARAIPDGQHDFDWEIGAWKTHLRRLVRPLAGSTTWVELDGVSRVRKVWDGRANLLELEADGPSGHFRGLSLRLYHPESGQWSLHFANAADGELAQPTIGQFTNGRGEF